MPSWRGAGGTLARRGLCVLAAERHDPVAGAQRGVPRDLDRTLDALVGRASLGMEGERALGRLPRVRGDGEVVVHVDRPDADRLADADDAPLDDGLVGLALERDLAPCQGA